MSVSSSFLVALSDDAVSTERGHRVWAKVGVITARGRHLAFSADYNTALPDAVCADIGKAVRFFLAETAAQQSDFRVDGFPCEFRVTRL